MDPRPIGVFDSGLGGLTAVRQLRRVLPGEDIVYFGDTGRVPYGSRGRDIIVQYARQDIRFLLQQDVKFIIAACGTVSSTYPPEEAARLPVPFTGVVGATARAAVDATRNKKVGIIGTAATVRSGSYAAVIRDMMPEVEIFARACPMFVPLVENGYFNDGNPVTKLIIAEYLQEPIPPACVLSSVYPMSRPIHISLLHLNLSAISIAKAATDPPVSNNVAPFCPAFSSACSKPF